MAKTEYKAIRVSKDVKDKAADAKRDGETWDEYVLRCTENPPEVREYAEVGRVADEMELLREHIDMVMREPVAEVNADVDTEEVAREVSRQLDYAQLAGKVGDEVEERLR